MDHEKPLDNHVRALVEMAGDAGDVALLSFLNACLTGYEDKAFVHEFTNDELTEILVHMVGMAKLLEDSAGED